MFLIQEPSELCCSAGPFHRWARHRCSIDTSEDHEEPRRYSMSHDRRHDPIYVTLVIVKFPYGE